MNVFIDSSALVKIFLNESGSDKVTGLIIHPKTQTWILDLAHVELQSAVLKKYRNNEIQSEQLSTVQHGITEQLVLFNEIHMSNEIIRESAHLIRVFGKELGLRTLDALHISGWLSYLDISCKFVTSDRVQGKVVTELGGDTMHIY